MINDYYHGVASKGFPWTSAVIIIRPKFIWVHISLKDSKIQMNSYAFIVFEP